MSQKVGVGIYALSVYELSFSDKTVVRSPNLNNGNYYACMGSCSLYWNRTLDLSSLFPGLPPMRLVTAWQYRSESPWWHTYQSPTQPQRLIHKLSTQPRNSVWHGKYLMNATFEISSFIQFCRFKTALGNVWLLVYSTTSTATALFTMEGNMRFKL